MTIQLRQICLVAQELEPAIDDLTTILGVKACFVDPGVGKFGLENTSWPTPRNGAVMSVTLRSIFAARAGFCITR